MNHDSMCPMRRGDLGWSTCDWCNLIAKVRADEKEKIITKYLNAKQKAGIESFGGWPVTPFKGEQQ